MTTLRTGEQSIQDWISSEQKTFPSSHVIKAISDATVSGRLDEAKLLKRLRDLSKAPKEPEPHE